MLLAPHLETKNQSESSSFGPDQSNQPILRVHRSSEGHFAPCKTDKAQTCTLTLVLLEASEFWYSPGDSNGHGAE